MIYFTVYVLIIIHLSFDFCNSKSSPCFSSKVFSFSTWSEFERKFREPLDLVVLLRRWPEIFSAYIFSILSRKFPFPISLGLIISLKSQLLQTPTYFYFSSSHIIDPLAHVLAYSSMPLRVIYYLEFSSLISPSFRVFSPK